MSTVPTNVQPHTDFFLSHTQRNGLATTLASELHSSLKEQGHSVWFDVKMEDRSAAAMRQGVANSTCVIAVITGSCPNPDNPDDPPEANAYFSRPFCVSELRWAKEAGVRIQPVIRAADKGRIGELMVLAPDDLQFLSNLDFIALDRSDRDYWELGVQKVIRAAGVQQLGAQSLSGPLDSPVPLGYTAAVTFGQAPVMAQHATSDPTQPLLATSPAFRYSGGVPQELPPANYRPYDHNPPMSGRRKVICVVFTVFFIAFVAVGFWFVLTQANKGL